MCGAKAAEPALRGAAAFEEASTAHGTRRRWALGTRRSGPHCRRRGGATGPRSRRSTIFFQSPKMRPKENSQTPPRCWGVSETLRPTSRPPWESPLAWLANETLGGPGAVGGIPKLRATRPLGSPSLAKEETMGGVVGVEVLRGGEDDHTRGAGVAASGRLCLKSNRAETV